MRLRSALLCACLAAWSSVLYAAPKVPLAAFVEEETYSHPRLSPDGRFIVITVRAPSGDRFVPIVMMYTLPDLKMAGARHTLASHSPDRRTTLARFAGPREDRPGQRLRYARDTLPLRYSW